MSSEEGNRRMGDRFLGFLTPVQMRPEVGRGIGRGRGLVTADKSAAVTKLVLDTVIAKYSRHN